MYAIFYLQKFMAHLFTKKYRDRIVIVTEILLRYLNILYTARLGKAWLLLLLRLLKCSFFVRDTDICLFSKIISSTI
jgi:hypothetical protein